MKNILQCLSEKLSIRDSFEAIVESQHLIVSNKKKCSEILKKHIRDKNDYIDFLIALHIVLEARVNGFFRKIVMTRIQKGVAKTKIADDLDKISFIDKLIFFFTLPNFNFQGQINEADRHYKAIGALRNFAETRNKLLHGHMVGEFYDSVSESRTKTRGFKLLSDEHMKAQVNRFMDITTALSFYFDSWDSALSEQDKADIKRQFLDTSFLGD